MTSNAHSPSLPWAAWSPQQPELPPRAAKLLRSELGELAPRTSAPLAQATVPTSRLTDDARARLAQVVGEDHVHVDDEARATHAGGQAYADVVRRRRGDAAAAPDAVVAPGTAKEVAELLRVCSEARIAVVPWGGGTSVVGGLDASTGAHGAVVALDLGRLDRLLGVDEVSMLATFEAGIRTPAADAALRDRGLTIGHVPQSYERASLGGYVVTRSAGQASTGIGRIDDLVAGLRMATPIGELALPALPASAAGPDLRRLVLGSEGTLGIVTEVTLRVRRVPDVRRYEGWMVPSWTKGVEALRSLVQGGVTPDIARLSDRQETTVSLAMSRAGRLTTAGLGAYLRLRRIHDGCLLITGYEGTAEDVAHRRAVVRRALRDADAVSLGQAAGRSWEHSRFAAPALRDTLLDSGAIAETLETAATWTDLPAVYAGVRDALTKSLGRAVVGCHVSHLYRTGASLYFTVVTAAGEDDVASWLRAKQAANDAIVAAGGTITHHHAVGTAHRDHVEPDLGGAIGVSALRAVKAALDPAGILNPGKLLPDVREP